jgi:PilZ domain
MLPSASVGCGYATEGVLVVIEKRRFARAPIDMPVLFAVKGGAQSTPGIGKDISIGGMFVQTQAPASFGSEVVVRVRLRTPSNGDQSFDLPGVVRWVRSGGMGVQFGLLGAVETHAITELTKAAGR